MKNLSEYDKYYGEKVEKFNTMGDKIDYRSIIEISLKWWDSLSGDKYIHDVSYYIVEDIINYAIILKDEALMMEWVDKIFLADIERIESGGRELIAGKVFYELGDFKKAREYFEITYEKGGQRVFSDKRDQKYYEFYLGKEVTYADEDATELSDEIYGKITKLSEEGLALESNKNYNGAIKKYKEALDLLPIPHSNWEASLWLNASLGDVYFREKNYQEAKRCFYDALNAPDGIYNPYINFRLGTILFELNEIDKAREFLLTTYMLTGEDILGSENPKYLKAISDLIEK